MLSVRRLNAAIQSLIKPSSFFFLGGGVSNLVPTLLSHTSLSLSSTLHPSFSKKKRKYLSPWVFGKGGVRVYRCVYTSLYPVCTCIVQTCYFLPFLMFPVARTDFCHQGHPNFKGVSTKIVMQKNGQD